MSSQLRHYLLVLTFLFILSIDTCSQIHLNKAVIEIISDATWSSFTCKNLSFIAKSVLRIYWYLISLHYQVVREQAVLTDTLTLPVSLSCVQFQHIMLLLTS